MESGIDWTAETDQPVDHCPTVADGTVYLGVSDHVRALAATDGTERWSTELPYLVSGSPIVTDSTIYVSSGRSGSDDGDVAGQLSALDRTGGSVRWKTNVQATLHGQPVLAGDHLFVGCGHRCLALDSEDGTVSWATDVDQPVTMAAPAVTDKTVYVGGSRSLTALDRETGERRWTFSPASELYDVPVVTGETVIFTRDTSVHALNRETGAERWTVDIGEWLATSPAVTDDVVLISGEGLYALDPRDGDRCWELETDRRIDMSPIVAGNTAYVGTIDGTLYAVNATTGTRQWTVSVKDTIKSISLGARTAYVGTYVDTHEGRLHAVARR